MTQNNRIACPVKSKGQVKYFKTGLCGITDRYGRFSLMVSIIPIDRSVWIYKELIMAITTISQLEGLAG